MCQLGKMRYFIDERYGSDLVNAYQIESDKAEPLSVKGNSNAKTGSFLARLRILFVTVFLPQGYPDSVSEDYLEYQIWDTAQAFCSSITGTFATRAVLKGYGVGDETATATAATITWLLKDGTSMVGRIFFAWSKGTQLDCDAKRWRLFADVLNDVSILVDLISPMFKGYFTLVSCISGLAKSIVGVAGGATRAALTQHQARRDNMADVSAKDGSQETLVNLMALIAGLVITPVVADSLLLVWILFAVFTFLHLYSNYKAVSAVVMETLNLPRLHILVAKYLESMEVLTPKQVGKIDPVVRAPGYRLGINLGCKLSDVIFRSNELNFALSTQPKAKYIICLNVKEKFSSGKVNIALHNSITDYELLESCFTAFILDIQFQRKLNMGPLRNAAAAQAISRLNSKWNSGNESKPTFAWELSSCAQDVTAKLFPTFYMLLQEAGWNMSTSQLGADEWRLDWQIESLNMKFL